jgi:ribose/xylose/arabinose/galactoside ABC-type transport system permease subunit
VKLKKEEKTELAKFSSISVITQKVIFSEYFVLYLSILLFLIILPIRPKIASFINISNVLSNIWPLFAIAIGQTFVLIVAGIDLSQTSIMALTSVIGAAIMTSQVNPILFEKSPLWGWVLSNNGGPLAGNSLAVPVAVFTMFAFGVIIGYINGNAVARLKMPPFMVTLVSQMFFGAFAIYLTKSENIIHLPDGYIALGKGELGFIPVAMIITLGLGFISYFILNYTKLGQWLYATGTNIKTSIVSGVPTKKVIIFAYSFSGFCAALSSVLYSARLEMGRPTLGASLLLDIVGATIIGGTSLFGGKGKVKWTLFGVLFFRLLDNSLNLLNLSFFTINIVKGSIILLAALIDVTRNRLRKAN